MKKNLLNIVIIILAMCTVGCGKVQLGVDNTIREEDEKLATDMVTQIIDALDQKNADTLKDIFSEYAIQNADNIDRQIEDIFDVYQGTMNEYNGIFDRKNSTQNKNTKTMYIGKYRIKTTEETYLIKFIWQTKQEEEPDKIGLYILQIVVENKMESYFSWVNELRTPGIYTDFRI